MAIDMYIIEWTKIPINKRMVIVDTAFKDVPNETIAMLGAWPYMQAWLTNMYNVRFISENSDFEFIHNDDYVRFVLEWL